MYKRQINNKKKLIETIKKYKPECIFNVAAETHVDRSIDNPDNFMQTNIIGTCNVVKACSEKNIKLIYFSSNYVYPGKKGYYNEKSAVLPFNNYAWSKLGGEAAVQMYKNSLILRICMTEKPFVHKKAFGNVKLNFIFGMI